MSKVTPTARQSAVAAGTVGLAAIGAVAGAAPAHAAGLTGGLPVSTNAVSAAGELLAGHGQIGGMSLRSIPLVGTLPGMLQNALPGQNLPLLDGVSGAPQQRSRLAVAAPHAAAPAAASAQLVQAPAMADFSQASRPGPAAAPSSPLDSLSLSSLSGLSGLTGGLTGGGLTGGLTDGGLAGGGLTGGDLLGGLTGGGGLTSGLGHLGG